MDIAAMSTTMAATQVQQQASLLMMRKIMDVSQQQADGLQQMLQSMDPNLGGNVDISV